MSWMCRQWGRLRQHWQTWRRRERRPLSDDVLRSRKELLQVFDGLNDPIVVIDRDYRIQRLNQATLAAVGGASFQALIGQPCYTVLHGRQDRCPQCTAPISFASGEKTERTGVMEVRPKPFESTYQISCHPLRDHTGAVTGVAEYYRDYSALVTLTHQLYESERARVIEPLISGLAHQIRQPLTVVRATAQLVGESLPEGSTMAELRGDIAMIIDNVDAINALLTDLLHFMKPSHYQMQPTSIGPVLERGIKLVQQRIRTQHIVVTRHWHYLLPIKMDVHHFLQAYLNLLTNALDAMPQGGHLTVDVLHDPQTAPPRVHVIIEDTGTGIPTELVAKIHRPFFTTKEGGVGLGVPIAESIIRMHGGILKFEHAGAQGTRVVIELPIAE